MPICEHRMSIILFPTPNGFFQFEIIIHVLVSPFRFLWIPMLWVYGHTYFNSHSAGIVFLRQNLTSTDVRFWRIKTVPALKGLTSTRLLLYWIITFWPLCKIIRFSTFSIRFLLHEETDGEYVLLFNISLGFFLIVIMQMSPLGFRRFYVVTDLSSDISCCAW